MKPEIRPGLISGSVIRKKVRTGPAPRSREARSKAGSTLCTLDIAVNTANGSSTCTSPTMTANQVPMNATGLSVTPDHWRIVLSRPSFWSTTNQP